jgi:iron complex transport system substrate-binding protein
VAGGSNLFHDGRTVWPQVSLEEIVRRKPDTIVLAQENPSDVTARLRTMPGWRQLSAVQNGQVFVVSANLFNRPGPHLPEAAAQLARIVHPEITR